MKPAHSRRPSGIGRKEALAIILSLSVLATTILSQGPAWWQQRGVIAVDANNDPLLPPDNFAALNLGQLKNTATKARDEIMTNLPYIVWNTNEMNALDALIAEWYEADGITPKAGIDNRALVNQGQLKSIAKHFYDVLALAHYAPNVDLPPTNWNSGIYPWTEEIEDDANFSPANLGQLKYLFSWDIVALRNSPLLDTDYDGMNNAWETTYGWEPFIHNSIDGDPQNDPEYDIEPDGYNNYEESLNDTSPFEFDMPPIEDPYGDSDGDGLTTGNEANLKKNPFWMDHPDVKLKATVVSF